jgi:hypothetical protein
MPISRLIKVPLRELWKHEAHGFTRWLAENLDLISDVIGIQLSLEESEAPAGHFSADILAVDNNGNPVVIENQLEQTNHDHLGKLITYMSNLDAKTAIWVTSDPRPEHERAVDWLNETLPADTAFYLLKIEAFKIGDSDPAPYISIIAGPNPVGKQIGEEKKEMAERKQTRREFWKLLLGLAKTKTHIYDRINPTDDYWLSAGSGKGGFWYSITVRMKDSQVELFFDRGDVDDNKKIFDALYQRKDEIETKFGEPLDWQRLDNRKGCRVRHVIKDYGFDDKEHWPILQEKLVEAMIRLHKALQPAIQDIA